MIELEYGHLNDKGEYEGDYQGCRVNCGMCKFINHDGHCIKLSMKIHQGNNVCNQYQPRIINPNMPEFNYHEYFEWLMNDYYRPYKSSGEIIGSGKLGEAVLDGGKLAKLLPNTYSYWYGTEDCLWCALHVPDCYIYIGKHKFQIDYRLYKNGRFIDGNEIIYKVHSYKEKETSRKYTNNYNGKIKIN